MKTCFHHSDYLRRFWFISVAIALIVTGPGALCAQSADIMDVVIAEETLTFGTASYLILLSRGEIDEDTSFSEAAKKISEIISIYREKEEADFLSLGEYSHLLMSVYENPGGLMYRLFPGPRYALRDLAFRGVVQNKRGAGAPISGKEALNVLERFLHTYKDL